MNPKQKQILVNLSSYEELISSNFEQISEMEKHIKELKRMNKVFVQKMIQIEKSYSDR